MRIVLCRLALVVCAAFALNGEASAASIIFTDEAVFSAAVSPVLIDDFETFAPKDAALASITSEGITYTPFGGSTNVLVASPGYNNFGAGVGTTTTSILTVSGDENILAELSVFPFAVGFDVYLNGLGPATATFFNGSDVVGSFTFVDGDDQRFVGILSDLPITSFQWTSTLGARLNTGIDNVQFGEGTSEVPEPATLLLLGAGLAAGARARRKTR